MAAKPDPTTTGAGKPDAAPSDTSSIPDTGDAGGGYDPSANGFDPGMMGDPTQMLQMMAPFMAGILIVVLAIAAFSIFCWWKIFSKAGYNGALALLFLAAIIPLIGPLVCLGLFIWFAFAEWPALKGQAKV